MTSIPSDKDWVSFNHASSTLREYLKSKQEGLEDVKMNEVVSLGLAMSHPCPLIILAKEPCPRIFPETLGINTSHRTPSPVAAQHRSLLSGIASIQSCFRSSVLVNLYKGFEAPLGF